MMAGGTMAGAAAGPADAGRLAWVDVAKGFCIILVVMMHSTLGTGLAMEGEGFLHTLVAFARPFRIPDFFLLSGLFLGRVIDRDWRLFLDRRLVHFAYFYVLWVVIQSAAKYGQIVDGAGPGAFVAHLGLALVEPYSTLWFIYLLAVFSVLTKLLRPVPAPLVLGAAIVLEILPIHTGLDLVDEFCDRYVWFLVGYLFAERIFTFADAVQRRTGLALTGLALWALVNAALVFLPTGNPALPTLAHLPGLGFALSGAGALAVVALGALMSRAGGPVTAALRACGQRSIVIYLAFFLPMALTRALLVKSGAVSDIGWVSLIVTVVAILVPLAFERAIRHTRASFLFKRPPAFHIAGARPRAADAALRPA